MEFERSRFSRGGTEKARKKARKTHGRVSLCSPYPSLGLKQIKTPPSFFSCFFPHFRLYGLLFPLPLLLVLLPLRLLILLVSLGEVVSREAYRGRLTWVCLTRQSFPVFLFFLFCLFCCLSLSLQGDEDDPKPSALRFPLRVSALSLVLSLLSFAYSQDSLHAQSACFADGR